MERKLTWERGILSSRENAAISGKIALRTRPATPNCSDLAESSGRHLIVGGGFAGPILACVVGARKRGINLSVAAKDAKLWWETGRVPLRPTPKAGQPEEEPFPLIEILMGVVVLGGFILLGVLLAPHYGPPPS